MALARRNLRHQPSVNISRLVETDLSQLLDSCKLGLSCKLGMNIARLFNPTTRGVVNTWNSKAELLPRLNDESLTCVLKEHLCRTKRFLIERSLTFTSRESGILRQGLAVDNHQFRPVIG